MKDELNHETVLKLAVDAQTGFLEGRILTLLDAMLADPTQRKAAKDICKDYFRTYLRVVLNRGDGKTANLSEMAQAKTA